MSFTVETGDLFAHPAQALAHGVNCMGVAGAGVARLMKDKYPDDIESYEKSCKEGKLEPGESIITRCADKDKWIIHCASQEFPGPDATQKWLYDSLASGLDMAHRCGIKSVALPLIGGGIGGLDPAVAQEIIKEVAEASPVAVTLVLLPND